MRCFVAIFNKIKFLIITIVDLLRYICCIKKNVRRPSTDYVPLSSVGVVPSDRYLQISSDDDVRSPILNSSNGQVRDVQNYIKEYREQKYKQMNTDSAPEVATDYFQDMTPAIVRQQKVLIQQNESYAPPSNINARLACSLSTASTIPNSNELASWEEMENNGNWDVDELSTDKILKEDRQLERQRRMMEKKRMDKERIPFGSKIS